MSILAECPLCRKKQSNKNKKCTCGQDLDKAKRSQSLKGMDAHYIVPSDESLTKAMDRYTNWLDGKLKLENVDQNVDQTELKT